MKKSLILFVALLAMPMMLFSQTYSLGDPNHSGSIDIVDALLVAQYYVGLNPGNFDTSLANVNASGSIDIVDALLIAQYYVGLITQFPGGTVTGDLYAAPGASDSGAGTLASPMSLSSAITKIPAGNTIFLRGGSYVFSAQLTIAKGNNGTANAMKKISAYQSEKPRLDFSSEPYDAGGDRGLQINADYWYVKGIEAYGAADNGIFIAGNHNTIESCVMNANKDSGLQLGRYSSSATRGEWPSYNLILNCESFDSYDPAAGENADGFACKLTTGPGNVFRGCISHNNIDDGWDLYTKDDTGAIDPVVIDQCVAYKNGTLTNGTVSTNGDRNGFKLGGEKIAVTHTVTRCVAFQNGKNGFTWNSNPGAIRISNCLSIDNTEGNYSFGSSDVTSQAIFTNNVSLWTKTALASDKHDITSDVSSTNCFWDKSNGSVNGKGLVVATADFANGQANPTVSRNADNTVNMSYFKLASGSDLINAGVIPGGTLPFDSGTYYKGAPDLGAYETN